MLAVRRGVEHRVGLEERAAGHRRIAYVGGELLDADVTIGEGRGDLGHDAGVVCPEQLEAQPLRRALVGLDGAFDGDLETLGLAGP